MPSLEAPKYRGPETITRIVKPGEKERPKGHRTGIIDSRELPQAKSLASQQKELAQIRGKLAHMQTDKGMIIAMPSGSELSKRDVPSIPLDEPESLAGLMLLADEIEALRMPSDWQNVSREGSGAEVVAESVESAPYVEQRRDVRRPVLMKEVAAIDNDPYYQDGKHSDEKKAAFTELVRLSATALGVPESMAEQFRDRWLMVGYLSRGGMGVVFEAYDLSLRKPAVLKFIANEYGKSNPESTQMFERFRREARSMAKISTHNVVRVYDGEFTDAGGWYAMEHVNGGSLNDYMHQQGPLKSREVTEISLQIAQGLKAAADNGVVHRDLKPDNVLYDATDRVYKLADFGLSKSIETQNLKLRWLEDVLRDMVNGQQPASIKWLDDLSSRRLQILVEDIQEDEKLKAALEKGSSSLESADPELFHDISSLALDIPDYSIESGYHKLLDAHRRDRLKWVAEQAQHVLAGEPIDTFHGLRVSDKVADDIQQFAYRLKGQPAVLKKLVNREELALEEIGHQADAEVIAEFLPEPDGKLTQAGLTLGTPSYMSPEQWLGNTTTEQSDIWALGVMMYEMLSGRLPFNEPDMQRLVVSVMRGEPAPINAIRPDAPKQLVDLIMRMLSKKPEDRPAIQEVIEVLQSPMSARSQPAPAQSSAEQEPIYAPDPRLRKLGSEQMRNAMAETVAKKQPGFFARLFGRK